MQFLELIGIVGKTKVDAEQEGQVNGVVWKDCQEGCVEKTLVQPHVVLGWKSGIGTLLTELDAVLWKASALWEAERKNQVFPSMMTRARLVLD